MFSKKKRGSQEEEDLSKTDTESEEEENSEKKTQKKKVLIKLSKKNTTESQVIGKKTRSSNIKASINLTGSHQHQKEKIIARRKCYSIIFSRRAAES